MLARPPFADLMSDPLFEKIGRSLQPLMNEGQDGWRESFREVWDAARADALL
jgi:hypothetical protein